MAPDEPATDPRHDLVADGADRVGPVLRRRLAAVAGALAVLTSSGPSGIALSVSSAVIVAATAVAVLLLSPSAAAYYGDRRASDRPAPRRDDKDGRPPLW